MTCTDKRGKTVKTEAEDTWRKWEGYKRDPPLSIPHPSYTLIQRPERRKLGVMERDTKRIFPSSFLNLVSISLPNIFSRGVTTVKTRAEETGQNQYSRGVQKRSSSRLPPSFLHPLPKCLFLLPSPFNGHSLMFVSVMNQLLLVWTILSTHLEVKFSPFRLDQFDWHLPSEIVLLPL